MKAEDINFLINFINFSCHANLVHIFLQENNYIVSVDCGPLCGYYVLSCTFPAVPNNIIPSIGANIAGVHNHILAYWERTEMFNF